MLDVNLPQAFNLATVLAGEGIATTVEVHPGGEDRMVSHSTPQRSEPCKRRCEPISPPSSPRPGQET